MSKSPKIDRRSDLLTEDWTDPLFDKPFVDVDEFREEPVSHRYVGGGFHKTNARFSCYFPPADRYEGRFFHNSYPLAATSDIGPFPIAFDVATGDLPFTLASGAYYLQTNNGGVFRAPGVDPAIAAYRVNAAAAKFSRLVAEGIYGRHRPYGYLFGGSGGAYQTLGAAENTDGIWDGFLPFVPGCNHAIPSMFTVRMNALRVLRQRDRFPSIVDAIEPGGSGNPYEGLNAEESAAFREVSQMGYPLRGWYAHATMDSGYFTNVAGMIPTMDPTYAEDFWSTPGYVGGDPHASVHAARYRFETSVASIDGGPPARIELIDLPDREAANAHLVVLSGEAAGASIPIARADGKVVTLISHLDPAVVGAIRAGDQLRVDNGWALALETYHRHQVPPETDYYGWNQFRDASGRPIYPQRNVLVGPAATVNSAGSVLTGKTHGKVLMLACLLDIDAFAWQADLYRSQVRAAKGPGFEDEFALWFIDNAHHDDPQTPLARAHAVSYGPALKQALRDLAAWVETGIRPAETAYTLVNTQVIVPPSATERKGVQPVVQLLVEEAERAEVAVGEAVTFSGVVEVPPGGGRVIAAEWDFEGSGDFSETTLDRIGERVEVTASHAYAKPGAYFPVLRGTSHRTGDAQSPHCRIQNIGRVRVVVS